MIKIASIKKIAIIERLSEKIDYKPFSVSYGLNIFYKEIFDKLNILLIPVVSTTGLEEISDMCDALILTGSNNDTYPKYYNEKPIAGKKYNNFDEYPLSKKSIQLFHENNKPILGICAGFQEINVAFGGSLFQKIPNHFSTKTNSHYVNLEKESFLYEIYQKKQITVNSYHKQALKKCAPNFKITAIADDGIVEAIENNNIIAVQWHPEALYDMKFFENFVNKLM